MDDIERTDRTRARMEADERMSVDQFGIEIRCQQRLTAAVAELRSAIQDVNAGSSIVKIDTVTFENVFHDELPSLQWWSEKIEEARHG